MTNTNRTYDTILLVYSLVLVFVIIIRKSYLTIKYSV